MGQCRGIYILISTAQQNRAIPGLFSILIVSINNTYVSLHLQGIICLLIICWTAVKNNYIVTFSYAKCLLAMLETIGFWHPGSYKRGNVSVCQQSLPWERLAWLRSCCHQGTQWQKKRVILTDPRFSLWQNVETTGVFKYAFWWEVWC